MRNGLPDERQADAGMKSGMIASLASAALTACAPLGSASPPTHVFPAQLKLTGTEPFWSIAIVDDQLTYSRLGQSERRTARISRSEGEGRLVLNGDLAGTAISVVIAPGDCSDGMSDRTYPYSVKVRYGDEMLEGCGSRR